MTSTLSLKIRPDASKLPTLSIARAGSAAERFQASDILQGAQHGTAWADEHLKAYLCMLQELPAPDLQTLQPAAGSVAGPSAQPAQGVSCRVASDSETAVLVPWDAHIGMSL